MAIQVLIRRKVIESKAKELSPLIVKLRSLATIQPGHISGEALNRYQALPEAKTNVNPR